MEDHVHLNQKNKMYHMNKKICLVSRCTKADFEFSGTVGNRYLEHLGLAALRATFIMHSARSQVKRACTILKNALLIDYQPQT